MKDTFITLEEHKVKKLPKQDEGSQRVDLAGITKRARLKAQRDRAEWEASHKNEEPENPYETLSDEELLVLAGEELTTKQMKTLLRERQLRGRRKKP